MEPFNPDIYDDIFANDFSNSPTTFDADSALALSFIDPAVLFTTPDATPSFASVSHSTRAAEELSSHAAQDTLLSHTSVEDITLSKR